VEENHIYSHRLDIINIVGGLFYEGCHRVMANVQMALFRLFYPRNHLAHFTSRTPVGQKTRQRRIEKKNLGDDWEN